MGLFSRKSKSIIVPPSATKAATEGEAMDRLEKLLPKVEVVPPLALPPLPDAVPKVAKSPMPPQMPSIPSIPPLQPKASKPTKRNKKVSVEPADFLALRAELIDMKARLDASEQARAMVESRLTSLDAAASAFTTDRNDLTEITDLVTQLQQQVAERAENGNSGGDSTANDDGHDELSAKVDALQNRLFGLQDPGPKFAEFEAQLANLRTELEATTAAAAEAAAMPPPPPASSGPDPETLERIAAVQQRVGELDDVEQRLAGVDGLAMQLQQLNARVAAQAELGGQLSALRDRVAQITEQPNGSDDDIRLQLQDIGERLRSAEELRTLFGQLDERASASDSEARALREHMGLLDQRLTNVSTELANQLGELGRDIDEVGQRIPEGGDGVVNDQVVDALRSGQAKLAGEQARFEIAFREDLAALAEQLRRARKDT